LTNYYCLQRLRKSQGRKVTARGWGSGKATNPPLESPEKNSTPQMPRFEPGRSKVLDFSDLKSGR
jgi:hypothetical protein